MPWTLASTSEMLLTLPFRRKRYNITAPDDKYSVIYLGNVLTIYGKGDESIEKPLALIWKTYCSKSRPDLHMKLLVTRSGLKAETEEQGLTEYWSHRITFASAPVQYPRLFCWIYKHEGKRMKPELRCHAVLCRKLCEPSSIALKLNAFLRAALAEYKWEKLCTEKQRMNAGNWSQPIRKQLLRTGHLHFRPPLNKCRSASRLGSIDEDSECEVESNCNQDEEDSESLCLMETVSSCCSEESSSPQMFRNDQNQTQIVHMQPDAVSDESGYHEEEKISIESDPDEPQLQITSF